MQMYVFSLLLVMNNESTIPGILPLCWLYILDTNYIQNYVQIETMKIVIVFEKNRLELDRLNEYKERFILILFKHDPLYNVI